MNEVFQDYGLEPKSRIGRTELNELKTYIETNYVEVPETPVFRISPTTFVRYIDRTRGLVFPPVMNFVSNGEAVGGCVITTPTGGGYAVDTELRFTYLSVSGGRYSFLWDFGDGTTSNNGSPFKTYTEVGTYSVSLTVSNLEGTVSSKKLRLGPSIYDTVADFITIIEPVPEGPVILPEGVILSAIDGVVDYRFYSTGTEYLLQYKLGNIDAASGLIWGEQNEENNYTPNSSISDPSGAPVKLIVGGYNDGNNTYDNSFDGGVVVDVSNLPQSEWTTLATFTNEPGNEYINITSLLQDNYSNMYQTFPFFS